MTNPGFFDDLDRAYDACQDTRVMKSIFDADRVAAARNRVLFKNSGQGALDRLVESGSQRQLSLVKDSMIEGLAELSRTHPNCVAAIDYLRKQLALSRRAVPPVLRWPPLLLDGPPGVGKTFFARALAELFDNALTVINCSSVTASFVLAGSSPSWMDSQPGKVFEVLVGSHLANPIVLLDEVDKLGGDHRFDAYGPLYQLLEEDTAKHFVDEQVGLDIDASDIIWLATSNNPARLPEPIASRFHVVTIAEPGRAGVRAVVQSVYHTLLARNEGWRQSFTRQLPGDVMDEVAGFPPRQVKRLLMTAMGNAALKRPAHRKLRIRREDLEMEAPPQRRGIGFVPRT